MSEPIKLLFVDDEEDFVEYMSMRLRRHDLDVEGYTNPKKALKETKGRTFDVALLDLKMPEMDGEDVMRELRYKDAEIAAFREQGARRVSLVKRKRDDSKLVYSTGFGRIDPATDSAPPRRLRGDGCVSAAWHAAEWHDHVVIGRCIQVIAGRRLG